MNKFNKIIQKIKNIFLDHCPNCKGIIEAEDFDNEIKRTIYKCNKCGKRWFII